MYVRGQPEASSQADWIDAHLVGRVIEVSSKDSNLHRRTMIVMAISSGVKFLQCVLICRHPEMMGNSLHFYKTHVEVFDEGSMDYLQQGITRNSISPVFVKIEDPRKYALRRNCYINYEHVWTVRREEMFRNIGVVEDFKRLRGFFGLAQRALHGY